MRPTSSSAPKPSSVHSERFTRTRRPSAEISAMATGADVEGAVQAGERGLAARVGAAAGDQRVQADLQLVGAERLDHAVVRPGQQQPGHVVGRGRRA